MTQLPTRDNVAFVKAHHQKAVGAGGFLPVAELDVRIPTELMGHEMIAWSRQCAGALGLTACVLDERGTFKHVGENVIVHDEHGNVVAVADTTPGVRSAS